MKFNSNDYEIKTGLKCNCGYNFNLHDIDGLISIEEHGFFGNNIKNISVIKCPKCLKTRALFLKQNGQTWNIEAVGFLKNIHKPSTIDAERKVTKSNEFICPVCKKVCKSELGLRSHLKTH